MIELRTGLSLGSTSHQDCAGGQLAQNSVTLDLPAKDSNLPYKDSRRVKIKCCNLDRRTRSAQLTMPDSEGVFQILHVLEKCPKCKRRVLDLETRYPDGKPRKIRRVSVAMHDEYLRQASAPDLELRGRVEEVQTIEGIRVLITSEWTRRAKRGADECVGYKWL